MYYEPKLRFAYCVIITVNCYCYVFNDNHVFNDTQLHMYIVFLPPCFALDICIMWATSGIHKMLKKAPKGYNKTIKLIIWFAAQQLTLSQLLKSRLRLNDFMASALVVAIHRFSCQETWLQIPDYLAWYYTEGELYHIYNATMIVLPWCFFSVLHLPSRFHLYIKIIQT